MLKDNLGLDVTTDDPAALAAVDDFVEGFLRYETRAADVLKAQGSACALANIYCGILYLFLETPDASDQAAPHLDLAAQQIEGCTAREAFTLQYAQTWQDALRRDDYADILALGETAREAYPGDLTLSKLHQYHCFNIGDAPAMLRAAQAAHKVRPNNAQVHAMLAFGYEQCHWMVEAEAAARTALAFDKTEPWAQHALAHVMLTQGRINEGAHFLESMEETWTGLNSFMLTHLWWHRALFYISLGRFADALSIYDYHTLNADPGYSQDQVGAVSLLARLELAGIDIADRWTALGQVLKGRGSDVVQPFLSLQYLYGLAKAGRPEADGLCAAISSQKGPEWDVVSAPAATALLAHARSDWDTAYTHMMAALPRMREIGGSHAQRDLFEQIALDAAIKSGRHVVAQQMIEARLKYDPKGVPLAKMRTQVNAALGLEAA